MKTKRETINISYRPTLYVPTRFKALKVVINETLKNGMLKSMVKEFANRSPHFFEQFMSSFIPLDDLSLLSAKS